MDTPETPKAMFTSHIDSRLPTPLSSSHSPIPSPEPDIGIFHTLPNGDVLETGLMTNPTSTSTKPHTPVPYEEVWRRLPLPHPVSSVRATFLRSNAPGGVAFLARVGRYQLGVCGAEAGSYWFYARRSEWNEEERGWREERCVGGEPARATLPLIPDGFEGTQGADVSLEGRVWVVLENS